MEQNKQEENSEETFEEIGEDDHDTKESRSGRFIGTGLVASAFLVLLLATAALVFFAIAALMRADWIMLAVGIVVIGLLLWLMSRLVRVAANQNKMT